jgi:hypothetical protein
MYAHFCKFSPFRNYQIYRPPVKLFFVVLAGAAPGSSNRCVFSE